MVNEWQEAKISLKAGPYGVGSPSPLEGMLDWMAARKQTGKTVNPGSS